MFRLLLLAPAIFALGEQRKLNDNSYKNIQQVTELQSLQKILSEPAAMQGNDLQHKPVGFKKPCPSNTPNRRSQSDETQYLRSPSTIYAWKPIQKPLKVTENVGSNNEESQLALSQSKNMESYIPVENLNKIIRLDCIVTDDQNIGDGESLLDTINSKEGGNQEKYHNTYGDEIHLKIGQSKKPCDITENSESIDSRRSMSEEISSEVVPSPIFEGQHRDISKYQHNLNLRSELIRNQLLAQIYNKGQVKSSGNDMNADIYRDHSTSQPITAKNVDSPNTQKTRNPQNKIKKIVKSHDLIEVVEKKPSNNTVAVENKLKSQGPYEDGKPEIDRNGNKNMQREFETRKSNTLEEQLIEPIKGVGISDMTEWRVNLMENPRVCYACSSTNEVTCWRPNKYTTVKYCHKEHDACITKTYKSRDQDYIVMRDCGRACDFNTPLLDSKYASCTICKNDLCNHLYVGSNAYKTFSNRSVLTMITIAGLSKMFYFV